MKKGKFIEQQIVFALKQAETRTRVDEVGLKMGSATLYDWLKKYRGLGVNELRLLKQLREENAGLD